MLFSVGLLLVNTHFPACKVYLKAYSTGQLGKVENFISLLSRETLEANFQSILVNLQDYIVVDPEPAKDRAVLVTRQISFSSTHRGNDFS